MPTTSTRAGALRYYRLALLVLGVALAAMIAATVYLAVRSTPTAAPSVPTTVSDVCFLSAAPLLGTSIADLRTPAWSHRPRRPSGGLTDPGGRLAARA